MSQRVDIKLIDDLARMKDPETDIAADVTILFSVDGESYEIDLSAGNAAEFRARMRPYEEAGRPTGRRKRKRDLRTARGEDTAEVRRWAKLKGYQIKDRGRIPADVLAEYRTEMGSR